MYPTPYVSAQRTVRTWATVGMVVFAAGSVVVGVVALGGHGGGGSLARFNVSFIESSEPLQGASGSAPMRAVTTETIMVTGSNITELNFTISWQDQTISPFTDPAVTATITGPNNVGSATGRVASSGTPFRIALSTAVPANTTVEAGSEAEAIAMAGGTDTNASMGAGEWTIALDVGSSLGIRPGGSISFMIDGEVVFFVGQATRL